MKTSSNGIKLIKKFEGCKLESYVCPGGVWTIGYGHTGVDVVPGLTITQETADLLLSLDLEKFEEQLNSLGLNLTQNQFDALISFIYNVGFYAFLSSTLFLKVKQEDYNGAAIQFLRWTKSKGRVLKGLVFRRTEELNLFKGGVI